MAVRFVIGRAGTGKTHHCLESVRSHLRRVPTDGERLILLVPEQASLQTERTLLDDPDLGATTRAEVLSFRRLAHRVLQQSGTQRRTALSGHGRAMVLRHLVGELRDRLVFYRGAERSAGFGEQLARTVGELIDEAVTPDDLVTEQPDGAEPPVDPLCAHKIADLRLIYAAYLDYLGRDKLDPSQHLELAREQIANNGWLAGAHVWVDGFAGFTGQQKLTLAALARVAGRIEITAMIDPNYATRACEAAQVEPVDLFAKTQRTYLDLWRALVEAGVEVESPLLLAPSPPPRFAGSPELARLERSVFAAPEGEQPQDGEHAVTLVEASDRRAEVDYVVSLICHLIRRRAGALRYRDVAIILRDLEPYHDLLSAALCERSVPFFLDRRRSMSHHPLVELLRGLVMLAGCAFSLESVRLLLKTDLLGLDRADRDALENYLLAHGIEGPALWRQREAWTFHKPQSAEEVGGSIPNGQRRRLERINRVRGMFFERVEGWYDAARKGAARTGREWAELLTRTLGDLGIAERLANWASEAEEDGDLDRAEQHRQIVRDAAAFVNDLCEALGDETMDVDRLRDVLNAGLSQFTLGLAPPMLDQVLVGSIERSRHPEIKIAIVMGLNESIFPNTGAEDSILNDDDREWLRERGVSVGVTRRHRSLEEPLLAYTALTRASERVVVTYAAANEEGKALRSSPYVEKLREACPELKTRRIDDGFRSRTTWGVCTSRDLAARMAFEWRNRPPPDRDQPATRTRWNDLYEASRRAEELGDVLRRALSSLDFVNEASISANGARGMVTRPFRASVSRLESFAACSFKHFAYYGLRLEERKEVALAAVDVGKIHHAILEQFVRRVVDERRSLADLDEREIGAYLDASHEVVAESMGSAVASSSARDAYVIRRSAAELARVLDAQKRVAQRGHFRPRGAEVSFGFDERDGWPALEIRTPRGRRLLLRGFIDRVDLAELADEMLGVVIDYKRTPDKRLDLSQAYHGLSLQLLGYLLVLSERGESLGGRPVQPAGAFYVSLVETYDSVDHPDDAGAERCGGSFSPRGVLSAEHIGAFDTGFAGQGQSQVYNLYVKKDGSLGRIDGSDGATPDDLDALLDHTRRRLGELADRIIDGDVSVFPYRLGSLSPCSWCDYRSVCRFEFGSSRVRYLEKLSRSQVFDRIGKTE